MVLALFNYACIFIFSEHEFRQQMSTTTIDRAKATVGKATPISLGDRVDTGCLACVFPVFVALVDIFGFIIQIMLLRQGKGKRIGLRFCFLSNCQRNLAPARDHTRNSLFIYSSGLWPHTAMTVSLLTKTGRESVVHS